MTDLSTIQRTIAQILQHMPTDWTTLTTHRLDIYDESKAKVQFVERLQKLMNEGENFTDCTRSASNGI